MKRQRMIEDKITFVDRAVQYYHYMFGPLIEGNLGTIEIRAFRKRGPVIQELFDTELAASLAAYKLCNRKYDVHFGFKLRIGDEGKKEGLLLFAYHASFDYGTMAHMHPPDYLTDVQPRDSRRYIRLLPSIIIHSGGRYDYYWVLNKPTLIANYGTGPIDLREIGDIVGHSIDGKKTITRHPKFLRVPGTYNFKDPNKPCEVELDYLGNKYDDKDINEALG